MKGLQPSTLTRRRWGTYFHFLIHLQTGKSLYDDIWKQQKNVITKGAANLVAKRVDIGGLYRESIARFKKLT